jgi:methanol metabolism-related c-type cytochrome
LGGIKRRSRVNPRAVRRVLSSAPTRQQRDVLVKHLLAAVVVAGCPFVVAAGVAFGDGSGNPAAVKNEDGKYYDKDSNPTYKVQSDGTVDWFTYSGYRRYHSDCHVCHGPDGEGSTYAPALSGSLKTLSYPDFANVVVNGRKNVNTAQESVMPSFGTNPNVMCYLDDIFIYLRARANDAIPRGRPQKHEDKSDSVAKSENACLGPRS